MDRARGERGLVAQGRGARRTHARRLPPQQRAHLAALLTLVLALPAFGADDIDFNPAITQQEFETFSRLIAQGIYATPIQPARASSVLGFDIGIAATIVPVDTDSTYWQRAVPRSSNFTRSGYAAVPRLVVAKGFGAGTLAGSYAKVSDTGISTWGGSLDVPIIRGGTLVPELAVRGAYSMLTGIDVFELKTYGLELFLSKGFGPFTPYAAAGRMRSDARGTIPATASTPAITLEDRGMTNRFTVGLRLSLLVPKITIEATQAEARSYGAKISFGF